MKTVHISLNSIDKVKAFVNDITKFDNDFDLVSGRYVIDAKSIMGIFSLDLSKPIELNIHSEGNVDEILSVLQPYIVDSLHRSDGISARCESTSRASFLFDLNNFLGCKCPFHHLIDFFLQKNLRLTDQIHSRLGYWMFCHKSGTTVFIWKNRSLICIDLL